MPSSSVESPLGALSKEDWRYCPCPRLVLLSALLGSLRPAMARGRCATLGRCWVGLGGPGGRGAGEAHGTGHAGMAGGDEARGGRARRLPRQAGRAGRRRRRCRLLAADLRLDSEPSHGSIWTTAVRHLSALRPQEPAGAPLAGKLAGGTPGMCCMTGKGAVRVARARLAVDPRRRIRRAECQDHHRWSPYLESQARSCALFWPWPLDLAKSTLVEAVSSVGCSVPARFVRELA